MIRFSLSLTLVIATLPALALAKPNTPQGVLQAAPYTLMLDAPCASTITVEGITGQKQGALLLEEGGHTPIGLSLKTTERNATLKGNDCEAKAHILVQPGTAIIARMTGFGALHITGVNGPLSLSQQGSNEITIDQASALNLDERGFGAVKLGWLNGPGTISMSGSGNVTIGHVDAPHLSAQSRGFSNIILYDGLIDVLDATVHGSGHVSFGGVARDANLEATGYGGITVHNVTGEIHQKAVSPGTISLSRDASDAQNRNREVPILALPDGTLITAHNLIKPDGTILSFRAAGQKTDATTRQTHHKVWKLIILGCVLLIFLSKISAFISRLMSWTQKIFSSASSQRVDDCPATPHQTQIAGIMVRLARLERRVGHIEYGVTSRDFHLHREFHTLSGHHKQATE